jgi:hypothetical protein
MMRNSIRLRGPVFITLGVLIAFAFIGWRFDPTTIAAENAAVGLKLEKAAMCEAIKDFQPVNPGIAFSVATGTLICYTRFSGISEDTRVLHRWYRGDALATTRTMMLRAPQWAIYSSIQLRESDRGPWRVDIVDADNRVIDVLRFSVTE